MKHSFSFYILLALNGNFLAHHGFSTQWRGFSFASCAICYFFLCPYCLIFISGRRKDHAGGMERLQNLHKHRMRSESFNSQSVPFFWLFRTAHIRVLIWYLGD